MCIRDRACNPIPAGAALASAITALRANDLPQAEPAVTAVTCIQAGTCNNVIPVSYTHLFSAICFTRRSDSKLARMSDLTFLVDASNQTLISAVPNQFFGKVILAFEELMGRLFR